MACLDHAIGHDEDVCLGKPTHSVGKVKSISFFKKDS